jgi:two-component system chemotaxis response regulator CheY
MYKILVVDDAGFMRKMVQSHLNKAGYNTFIEAEDGQRAVVLYQENNPDLVIMDITMPNMDGIEALRRIKQINPNAKVIMCSAMGLESMVMEAIKLGALDFIVKPFKPERIVQTVSKILPI